MGVVHTLPEKPVQKIVEFLVLIFPIFMATKEHWASSILYAASCISLFFCWKQWRFLERWEKQLIAGYVLFFAVAFLSFINSDDLHQSMKRLERLLYFPVFVPMYLSSRRLNMELSRHFLIGMLLAAPVMFGVAVYQVEKLNFFRAVGAYNSIVIGDLAIISALIGFCALGTAAFGRRMVVVILIVLSSCFALYTSMLSGSRGAWIVLPFAGLFYLWLVRMKFRKKRLVVVSILVLGVISLPLLSGSILGSRLENTQFNMSHYLNKTQGHITSEKQRFLIWKIAIDEWKKNPLLGSGLGDFYHDSGQKVRQGETELKSGRVHAHSIYFEYLSMTGLLGFGAMLVGVLIMPFRSFYRRWGNRNLLDTDFANLAGMMCVLAFGVFGLTENWLARSPMVATYVMCVFSLCSRPKIDENVPASAPGWADKQK